MNSGIPLHYRVSESYLADRRGGPRRASIMMALVFGFVAFLFYWQRHQMGQDSILFPLAFTAIVMVGIGYSSVRRMKKMTVALESLLFTVTADGIATESLRGPFTLKTDDIRKIIMYRTVLAPKITYFVVASTRGDASIPPLENADKFAREIQAAMPTIPFVQKRKLIVNLGA